MYNRNNVEVTNDIRYLKYIMGERIVISTTSMLSLPFDEDIVEARTETFDQLSQWMSWATEESKSKSRVREDMKEAEDLRENFKAFRFDITMGVDGMWDDGRYLGSIAVLRTDGHTAEIGYWIRKSDQRKGYARESLVMMTHVLSRLGIRRIEVRTDFDNHASMRVAISAGYKLEGLLRGDRFKNDGRLSNTMLFSFVPGIDPLPRIHADIKYRIYHVGTVDRTELITSI